MAYSDSQASISLSLCNTCAKLGICSSANMCNTKSILFCNKCYTVKNFFCKITEIVWQQCFKSPL